MSEYLTDADREALRFAFIHYHPDYDEGSRAYEVVEKLAARVAAETRESVLDEAEQAIRDAADEQNAEIERMAGVPLRHDSSTAFGMRRAADLVRNLRGGEDR